MASPSPYMARALAAARQVRGFTSPNPWVGAVVVRDGGILSVGATSPPGGPHAEAAALAGTPDARGADVYVTLEPCAPFPGKRTPPCAQALVDAGVRRVVVALEDPDPGVRGRGIALLRESGVVVEVGDGDAQALALLRPYVKHRQSGLPYVILKFAASLDGRVATASGDSKWVTGESARDRAHQERAWVDAVLVGSGTVLADDPMLTARPGGRPATRQPARVVLDSRGRVSATATFLHQPGHAIVATAPAAPDGWKRAIAATGAQVIECESDGRGINLHQLLATLGRRGVMSAWVEGGPALLGSMLDEQLADELWAFIAPVVIGGDGLPAVGGRGATTVSEAFRLVDPHLEELPPDILVRGYTGMWDPR